MMKRIITLLLLASSSFAAQTISTIAVSGSSATVTTVVAHGLSLNQGIATVEALIQGDYASNQAAAPSPCQFYGFTWDPTSNAWAKQ